MTQSNSRSRVKQDGIGEAVMKQLYSDYTALSTDQFRVQCKAAIERSHGKSETKNKFYEVLDRSKSKDQMVQKVTNYFLAGEGRGV